MAPKPDDSSRFRIMADIYPIGITAVNISGILIYANPYAIKLLGLSVDKVGSISYDSEEWKIADLDGGPFPPDKLPFSQVISKKAPVSGVEHAIQRSDGTRILLSINAAPCFDESGAIDSVVFAIEDITRRVEKEKKLQASEERLSYVIGSTSDGFWDWDVKSGKTYFSPRYYTMIGYEPDEFPPTYESWRALVHPQDLAASEKVLDDCFNQRTPSYEMEFRIRSKSGQYVWILGRGMVVTRDAGGAPIRMCGTHTDISAWKNYETDIIASKEKAEAASRAKSLFLANMSHELRTPMNGILGFTCLLSSSGLNGQQADFNNIVKRSACHLLDLINNMLDFSKLEARKITLEQKPFSIVELVSNLREMIEEQLGSKGLLLDISVGEGLAPEYIGDFLRVKQILLNLLTNAIKFTPAGKISLKVERLKTNGIADILSLTVADEGIGIPDEKRDEIFDMFHQLDESHSKKFAGLGLGLSIVRELVSLMGGSISVSSEPGKGSSFACELPFIINAPASALTKPLPESLPAAPPPVSPGHDKPRILVAEDDDICAMLLASFGRQFEWEMTFARNGREAVEKYMGAEFDAVIMDGQMPLMDGFEAAQAIRAFEYSKKKKRTPIIALTAYALSGDREKFIEAGMDDYVTKPILDYGVLLKAVRESINL